MYSVLFIKMLQVHVKNNCFKLFSCQPSSLVSQTPVKMGQHAPMWTVEVLPANVLRDISEKPARLVDIFNLICNVFFLYRLSVFGLRSNFISPSKL